MNEMNKFKKRAELNFFYFEVTILKCLQQMNKISYLKLYLLLNV